MSTSTSAEQAIIAHAAHIPPEQQIYMMSHIGGVRSNGHSDQLDRDLKQTNDQKKLIDDSREGLYKRVQHNEQFNLPNRGVDVIQNVHPLSVTMLSNHGDKGFDYRDFPEDIAKDHQDYDPFIGYLHNMGLIGKNKSRYNINYLLIDSSYRRKNTIVSTSYIIKLNDDPLMFNGQELAIFMSDTSNFSLNDKITIRGITPRELTLRSVVTDDYGNTVNYFLMQNGLQFMIVSADNNMDINSGLTSEIKDIYTSMTITFNGFVGDVRTDWYFNTTNYIWDITNTVLQNGDPGFLLNLTENVHAVTAASSNLPEADQVREDMIIAQITLDIYGTVVAVNNGYPYAVSDLRWTEPPEFSGQGTPPVSVPSNFNTLVLANLTSASLIENISLPNNLFNAMQYIQDVQNVVRPIFLSLMSDNDHRNFGLRYNQAGTTYVESVRIAVPENTIVTTSSQIGNISLNLLNRTHRMYLTSADIAKELGNYDPSSSVTTDVPVTDKFYIKLTKPYQKRQFTYMNPLQSGALAVTIYQDSKSDVTITYNHYGGVPINNITAESPVGFTSTVPYRYITQIVQNSYIAVDLGIVGFLGTKFGGPDVSIGLIEDLSLGYSQPHKYVVELDKPYTNVVMVRMVTSLFPVTQGAFVDGSNGGKKNNAFYWQNADDSETVYKIEIGAGNYTAPQLKDTFETAVKQVFRVSDKIITTKRNVITLDIDEKIGRVLFTNYNEYIPDGEQTFISATSLSTINTLILTSVPVLPEDAYYGYPNGGYFKIFNASLSSDSIRIIVYQPNNNLRVKDSITIKGSLNFGNIPETYINGTHTVTRVSGDYYDFLIDNVNTDPTLDPTVKGGDSIFIYTPNLFRIRFDYSDTIGGNLGFRDVGQATSITPYDYAIDNDVIYDGENATNVVQSISDLGTDTISTTTIPVRYAINLKGPPYIIITCTELPNIISMGPIKSMFYTISMNDKIGSYIKNSFSKTPIFYNDPIKLLSSLSFDIYSPDGSYYDFNGVNHAFILQIITYDEIPEGTAVRH
jgi:hypothetical protein